MNNILKLVISLLLVSLSTCQIPKLPSHIGKGYDILAGNPLTNKIDPGFRNQIFDLSYNKGLKTGNGKYLIPDGMEATDENICSFNSKTEEITGSQSYQNSLRQSVEVEGGYNGPIAKVSFMLSVNYQNAKTETSSEKKIVYLSMGECAYYTLDMPSYETLPLSKDFISGVKKINKGEATWAKFIAQFGTHYVDKVTFGGRMVISTSFSLKDCTLLKSSQIDIAASIAASYAEFKGSTKSNNSLAEQFSKATSKMNKQDNYIYTGGETNTNNDWNTWTKTVTKNLAPIKYSLVEISELFTSENFPDINSAQLYNMKEQFIKEALNRPNFKDLTVIQPDNPLPTVIPKIYYMGEYTMDNYKGGKRFDFESSGITAFTKVKSVTVCYKKFLVMIEFTVIDSVGNEKTLQPLGGYRNEYGILESGKCSTWNVMNSDDEYINTATIHLWFSGKEKNKNCVVRGLQFKTNKGRSNFWGDKTDTEVKYVDFNGFRLIGTYGESGYPFSNSDQGFYRFGFVGLLKYVGCYEDKSTDRDLNVQVDWSITKGNTGKCISVCKDRSFAYAGVQNGGYCYCGNNYGKYRKLDDVNGCLGGNSIFLVD